MKYYKKDELLFKTVSDGVEYYVFPSSVLGLTGLGAEERVNRAINGKDTALLPASTSTDRHGDFIKLNVKRTNVWESVLVELPEDIISSIERLEEIDLLPREDITEEIAKEYIGIKSDVEFYFSKG